jgi:putative nucleotidyltransferase with HDIG domain
MSRINGIFNDEDFLSFLRKIEAHEKDRIFCRHDLSHLLDVCRLAWILNLERDCGLDKELVYGAGLLHDIGRWVQYETGEDHAAASARLCVGILRRSGFEDDEIAQIKAAIVNHRSPGAPDPLSRLIYLGDKLSRNCFCCRAASECKKPLSEVPPEI